MKIILTGFSSAKQLSSYQTLNSSLVKHIKNIISLVSQSPYQEAKKPPLLRDTSHFYNIIDSAQTVHEQVEIYLYKETTKKLTSKINF